MDGLPLSARTLLGALATVVALAGWALPAAGQDAAAADGPAVTVTAPQPDAVLRSAPTVVVAPRRPVDEVTVRLVRDGSTLAEARQSEASESGEFRVRLPAGRLAAVANGPAQVQARAGDEGGWIGHAVVLDLDPLPTTVTATASQAVVDVAWDAVPLAPEGRYEVQRSLDGEHFQHVAASESRADTTLRDGDRPPGRYHYRVVVTRPGADPGTRRQATSAAVAVTVHEPEPTPQPTPAPSPQPAPRPAPQSGPPPPDGARPPAPGGPARPVPAAPQPPREARQPGSDASPGRSPRQPPPASGAPAGATDATGPGPRDVAAATGERTAIAGPPDAPRRSSSMPRLQPGSELLDGMVALGDVPAPEVAPPEGDTDSGGSARAAGRDAGGAMQAREAAPATLDVVSGRPLPRHTVPVLLGLLVFGSVLFALRRRV